MEVEKIAQHGSKTRWIILTAIIVIIAAAAIVILLLCHPPKDSYTNAWFVRSGQGRIYDAKCGKDLL